ncbi:MAG TPA: hypothetical protein VFD33_05615 [Bacillota bacterium]|nr:hypothetical protein [Bacillota bacterium]
MGRDKNKRSLEKLSDLQREIGDIHQLFSSSYPVTIVENNVLYIYDLVQSDKYDLVKTVASPFPVPVGVRAAFPLEAYDMKISAVVTGDVFDSKEGYVTILHEFVHCAQYNSCEADLKEGLDIWRKYRLENNHTWEISHSFPYDNKAFIDLFSQYNDSLAQADIYKAKAIRMDLMKTLGRLDFEYLIWQEWKEGLARYIENEIRARLGLKGNHYGHGKPYTRISFYESGSEYIRLIDREKAEIVGDMGSLFFEMNTDVF